VGVAGHEQVGEPPLELGDPLRELGGLRGERRVLRRELTRGAQVGAGGGELLRDRDDRPDLGVPPAQLAGGGGVGVHGGVGEPQLQLGVLGEHGLDGRC
jgi:hypothetical protein